MNQDFNLGCFAGEPFSIGVDVEGKQANQTKRFRALFNKHWPDLKNVYEEKGIELNSPLRGGSIATKTFSFTRDLSCIEDEYQRAMEEFLFLIPYIDKTIEDYLTNEG